MQIGTTRSLTLGENGLFLNIDPNRAKSILITITDDEQYLSFFLYQKEVRALYDWLDAYLGGQ